MLLRERQRELRERYVRDGRVQRGLPPVRGRVRQQQQHEQLRGDVRGVRSSCELDGNLRRYELRLHLQCVVPLLPGRAGWPLREQQQHQQLRIVVHGLHAAGELDGHVQRHQLRLHVQRRLPRVFGRLLPGHRLHALRRDVHGLPDSRKRHRDLHGRDVRDLVQRRLSQLQRSVCQQLEYGHVRRFVHLVRAAVERNLDVRWNVVRLFVQRAVQRVWRRLLRAVHRRDSLWLVLERVLGDQRNAVLHERCLRHRVVQRRVPRVQRCLRQQQQHEQLRNAVHSVSDGTAAPGRRDLRRRQLWADVPCGLRQLRRQQLEWMRNRSDVQPHGVRLVRHGLRGQPDLREQRMRDDRGTAVPSANSRDDRVPGSRARAVHP